jgi:inosine-uridine nucleoside N-ribohydrolase
MIARIIIDTDPGIDDAMAILYAIAAPDIELLGLTTIFGNVTTEIGTRNALQLLELAGVVVPVARGADKPLRRELAPPADFVHGAQGFGEVLLPPPSRKVDPRPAARFIAETILENPGDITLVAVGPLTNLALALREAPEITTAVGKVVVMGGAVRTGGNVTEHAEANIWNDPDAAAEVFAADWPLTLVGLDVTQQVRCDVHDLEPMRAASPACGPFLNEAVKFYFRFHERVRGFTGCYLHDPSAVICATQPEWFETVEAPLTVTVDGDALGRTREGGSFPPQHIAIGVNAEAVKRRFLEMLKSGRLP